ncbi:YfhD family protein [Cohnella endophytica]|uniref:YfhD family protein n=1 Tax=Cohnella endophytica TaxID=2419778 RepID=A0A494XZK8_9BACL|nr:YfhD family protein [Cohnella endophytica]
MPYAYERLSLRGGNQLTDDQQHKHLPVVSAEDVEFADELADSDDKEAQKRAAEADRRVTSSEGE